MGKLLQKLVAGLVPSWLTKIKSSVDSSPKKLLPYFKGSTHVSSPSPPTAHYTEVPRPLVAYGNPDHSKQDVDDDNDRPAKACTENPAVLLSPSETKKAWSATSQDDQHQGQCNDRQQQHHVHVKISTIQSMQECNAVDDHSPPEVPSSRKQGAANMQNIDKHDHYHHPQHYQKNCKNQSGIEKRDQCMPEGGVHYHQQAQKYRQDAAHLCDFLELGKEDSMCLREDNLRNYHDYDYYCLEEEHYRNLYHDLLGVKRKSQYLQEEEEEGQKDNAEGSCRSNFIDTTGWEQKRRKEDREGTRCELPESLCGILGTGRAVVKYSLDPHVDLWESMVEMIVGNGLWDLGSLEFLLFCYLSLNEAHLHPIIHSSFLQALQDLEKI